MINIINAAPVVITPGPAVSINTVEGFRNVDAIVGTFTVPIPIAPAPPVGFPASDFTATIDWGDPSPDLSAGHDHPGRQQPQRVLHHGHAHLRRHRRLHGRQHGGVRRGLGHGSRQRSTDHHQLRPARARLPALPATATVTQGPLAVSVFPIVGTEGIVIPSAPIATFIDAGGADPVTDYSATITITDSTGAVVVTGPAASITQNADAAQFTVNAPAYHAA